MADTANQHWTKAAIGSVVRRRRVLLAGLVLAGLAWTAHSAWRRQQDALRRDPHFGLTADAVTLSDAPPWAPPDLRQRAIERAELQGPLSVLDTADLTPRLAEAFRLEPWVKAVRRVEVQPTGGVLVELQYRRPVAAVLVTGADSAGVLPVDGEAVRLPTGGLTDAHLRRLPRITSVYNAPPNGEPWTDRRVLGALSLIDALKTDWSALSLADITPSVRPEIRGEQQFYTYEVTTTGGTRIVWGASPHNPAPDEPHFQQKLSRLKEFVATNQIQLDGRRSPQSIDLRYGLQATRRIAKKTDGERTAQKADAVAEQAKVK